ncbi:hypothetical protein EON80_27985 [bacterium]|nr:MAG: hypothetical protein EON80_27985 [bacterium]
MGKSDRGDVHAGPLSALRPGGLVRVREGRPDRPALIATGSMVRTALEVAAQMSCAVWSAPFIKPGLGDDIFLSLSHTGDENSAPNGWRALNVSTHVHWREWQGLSKLEYREMKKIWRDTLLKGVRIALPQLDEGRGFVITGTPSTWEHYTGRVGGNVGGAALTRRNANLRALPSRLGIENFHLVGDTTFPGQGTVACALSGFNAWRDITGQ